MGVMKLHRRTENMKEDPPIYIYMYTSFSKPYNKPKNIPIVVLSIQCLVEETNIMSQHLCKLLIPHTSKMSLSSSSMFKNQSGLSLAAQ